MRIDINDVIALSALLLGDPDHYADLPTAFCNPLADLSSYFLANSQVPMLTDPSCPTEDLNHRCDQDQYTKLRKWIKYYSEKATAALQETDPEVSRKFWRETFGDDFGAAVKAVTKATQAHVGRVQDSEQFLERDLGIPVRLSRAYEVAISAQVQAKPGFRAYDLRGHGGAVMKNPTVRFRTGGCTVNAPYKVYWKVRNTGEEAIQAKDIRGQMEADQGNYMRDENTKYRGKHYVECYVVKNSVCVAKAHQVVVIK